jgi:hypothetical protein
LNKIWIICLEQSDKRNYTSILNGLSTQYLLGKDQHPKSMVEEINVLNKHKFDAGLQSESKNDQHKEQAHLSSWQLHN